MTDKGGKELVKLAVKSWQEYDADPTTQREVTWRIATGVVRNMASDTDAPGSAIRWWWSCVPRDDLGDTRFSDVFGEPF